MTSRVTAFVVLTGVLAGGIGLGVLWGRGQARDVPALDRSLRTTGAHGEAIGSNSRGVNSTSPKLVGRAPPGATAPGTAVLAIGDGLRLSDGTVVPRATPYDEDVDAICLDLRDRVALLQLLEGGATGTVTLFGVDEARSAAEEYALMSGAPETLEDHVVMLRVGKAPPTDTPSLRPSRVVFIRARSGVAYKVVAAEYRHAEHALKRTVAIRFDEVPSRQDGGTLGVGGDAVPMEPWNERLRLGELLRVPKPLVVAHQWARTELPKTLVRLSSPPEALRLDIDHASVVIPDRLDATIEVPARGVLLILAGGVGPTGRVIAKERIGLVVLGGVEGTIEVRRGSVVRVTGGISGRVSAHGTVIVDGDVTGELDLRGFTRALVNGEVLEFPRGVNGRGVVNLYLRGRVHSAQVRLPAAGSGMWSLYLHDSDLAEGRHGPIKSWASVVVGGPVWEGL